RRGSPSGVARGTRALDLRSRSHAPGRDAEADPDASIRVLARRHRAPDVRLWIPGRGRTATPQLDVRATSDGDSLGSGDGDLHPQVPVKNRLRVLRAELGWSQAGLAERLGVSRHNGDGI